MRKNITIATAILLGFLAILWLQRPLRELLLFLELDAEIIEFSSGIIIRTILIILTILVLKRLQLERFSGISPWTRPVNLLVILIPFSIIIMAIIGNWDTYLDADGEILLLFGISTLLIGIAEELIFRGTIFPLFIRALKHIKRPILLSALLSNLMFGMVHFVNLLSQPENFTGILSQVFFALAIGVFFCGLMVRTENILIPVAFHALVNFGLGTGELKKNVEELPITVAEEGINWNSVIPTTLLFSIILAAGVYMIVTSNEEKILEKLSR